MLQSKACILSQSAEYPGGNLQGHLQPHHLMAVQSISLWQCAAQLLRRAAVSLAFAKMIPKHMQPSGICQATDDLDRRSRGTETTQHCLG